MCPTWNNYRNILQRRGFRLDTCRDVKQFYLRYWENLVSQGHDIPKDWPGYIRACNGKDDDDLCKDAGLPENLFRGTSCINNCPVVVKAVHSRSREYDVVRYLSTPPVRNHPMNHCIPVLDLIEVPDDNMVFIVMEEWSPHLITDTPYTLRCFLATLRQHLEHVAFMHSQNIAHLDIALRNILTDNNSRYACIDFEMSRRFDTANPRLRDYRGSECPPETECGEWSDPYKIDVWASGMLIVRASKLTGYPIPELCSVATPMLREDPKYRCTAREALLAFNAMVRTIGEHRLNSCNL